MMDVRTNGRALAIAIGDSLALPSGRLVRLADINADAWEPADADPEDANALAATFAGMGDPSRERTARTAAENVRRLGFTTNKLTALLVNLRRQVADRV